MGGSDAKKGRGPSRVRSIEGRGSEGLVRELFGEYLREHDRDLRREWGVGFDAEAALERDMREKLGEEFGPPDGRLLLAYDGEESPALGCCCLRGIGEGTGEVKRTYVRPEARGRGVGRALLRRLSEEARAAGYRRLMLDSAPTVQAAHALYRSAGFRETGPYPESEIPEQYRRLWVFMRLDL